MSRTTHGVVMEAAARGLLNAFLTQREAAAVLRLSERTLERHRLARTGPVFIKLGRRVVYREVDLEAWAAANTYRSTSEFPA